MREVIKEDKAIIYHTGKQRCVAGVANVVSGPYPDPKEENEKLVVFDITPDEALNNQVTLSEIKGDNRFSDFHLVKFSRLSVMPVDNEHWELILKLSK